MSRKPPTEEEALALDMALLDDQEPDWDRDARVIGARTALELGMSPKMITIAYGAEVLELVRNQTKSRRKVPAD